MSRAKRVPFRPVERDPRRIATLDELVLRPVFSPAVRRRYVDPTPDVLPLVDVSDGRLFDPDPYASSDVSVGYRSRLRVPPLKTSRSAGQPGRLPELYHVGARLGYLEPDRVASCVRRKVRKEVLHAKGVAGSPPRKFKRRRRGPDSDRSC